MIHLPRWQVILIGIVVLFGFMFTIPNFFDKKTVDKFPNIFPKNQIYLGLDLQGGSHILLEVDVQSYLDDQMEALVGETRKKLRSEKIRLKSIRQKEDAIIAQLTKVEDSDKAFKAISSIEPGLTIKSSSSNFTIAYDDPTKKEKIRLAVEQSIEIVRRRIDETGTKEPIIQKQGENRIVVQLPGIDDPDRIKKLLGKTAKMSFHMVDHKNLNNFITSGRVPAGSIALENVDSGRSLLIKKRASLSGDHLIDSKPTYQDGMPVVNFRFDTIGSRKFGKITSENVKKQLAIVLDGKIISAPVIQNPITTGNGIISGDFTAETANDLAILLRAGALPAPLDIIEERTVGPSLGQDSIEAGSWASLIGLIAVMVMMIVIYRYFGVMATFALLLNMILITASLSLLQATLTLPGIAGIVLTIGMAVDANVLIFERIKEEYRNGRTLIKAIDMGYRRAITTIVDANLTTLIAALLLFNFGSGPIKGFAVTLSIGLLTSMFTAIMFTRFLIVSWLKATKSKTLPFGSKETANT